MNISGIMHVTWVCPLPTHEPRYPFFVMVKLPKKPVLHTQVGAPAAFAGHGASVQLPIQAPLPEEYERLPMYPEKHEHAPIGPAESAGHGAI